MTASNVAFFWFFEVAVGGVSELKSSMGVLGCLGDVEATRSSDQVLPAYPSGADPD